MEFAFNRRRADDSYFYVGAGMPEAITLVMVGAAVGGIVRFLVTHFFSEWSQHHGFPYGTLVVNVVGSFLVGYVLTWATDNHNDRLRLLAATGFCGGFTTFSAFAFETMAYYRDNRFMMMALNVALNNVIGMLALVCGVWIHHNSK
jgi:fluoride exporter